MTPRHGTGKPDRNQADIVEFVRSWPGTFVQVLSQYPGQLDLLVYYRRRLTWWEIKPPGQEARISEAERRILTACPGATFIVSTIDDARAILEQVHA